MRFTPNSAPAADRALKAFIDKDGDLFIMDEDGEAICLLTDGSNLRYDADELLHEDRAFEFFEGDSVIIQF